MASALEIEQVRLMQTAEIAASSLLGRTVAGCVQRTEPALVRGVDEQ
jgi:hypothetical protein